MYAYLIFKYSLPYMTTVHYKYYGDYFEHQGSLMLVN